jgi:hypothetical protein
MNDRCQSTWSILSWALPRLYQSLSDVSSAVRTHLVSRSHNQYSVTDKLADWHSSLFFSPSSGFISLAPNIRLQFTIFTRRVSSLCRAGRFRKPPCEVSEELQSSQRWRIRGVASGGHFQFRCFKIIGTQLRFHTINRRDVTCLIKLFSTFLMYACKDALRDK